jgi:hypothetical protein
MNFHSNVMLSAWLIGKGILETLQVNYRPTIYSAKWTTNQTVVKKNERSYSIDGYMILCLTSSGREVSLLFPMLISSIGECANKPIPYWMMN